MLNLETWRTKTLDAADLQFKHLAGKSYGGFLQLIVYTLAAAVTELYGIHQAILEIKKDVNHIKEHR